MEDKTYHISLRVTATPETFTGNTGDGGSLAKHVINEVVSNLESVGVQVEVALIVVDKHLPYLLNATHDVIH